MLCVVGVLIFLHYIAQYLCLFCLSTRPRPSPRPVFAVRCYGCSKWKKTLAYLLVLTGSRARIVRCGGRYDPQLVKRSIEWVSDAMHKLGYCRHAVSVCLSVTFVSCAKTNKDIFEIFPPSGSQAILVFPYQTGWRYSDGNPRPNGGVECKGVWKKMIFDQYLALSQKRL